MSVQDFRELKVYRLAFSSAMQIFEHTLRWPRRETYSLTDQILRSSRSVCGNIAEAWKKRRYPAHFISKLSDASAEAAETEVWLDFAHPCRYLAEAEHRALRDHYDHVGRMLSLMMTDADRWCSTRPEDEHT